MRNELPVIQRIYDMILWMTNHLDHFPRARRYTLGTRIEDTLYDLLERCIEARYTRDKAIKIGRLRSANTQLEKLRYFIRLCHDQQLMSTRQYGFVSEKINDIGVALGGWSKEVNRRQ